MLAVEARFIGTAGLAAMTRAVGESLVPQRLESVDPHGFTASVVSIDLEEVRVVRAIAPALRSVRPPGSAARPEPALFVLLGLGARGEIVVGGSSLPVDPGHVVLIPSDACFEVVYPGGVDVVFVAVDAGRARRLGLEDARPLRGTALTTVGRAVLRPALDAVICGAASASPDLAADLGGIVEAALGVALRPVVTEVAADPHRVLQAAALRLVDRHLQEPDLGPGWLAARLHVSPCTLHRAFRDGEQTVAVAVRRRRVEAVARELRRPAPQPGIAELAARYGFAGGSHLATAFRAEFGMPPADYRACYASAQDVRRS